MLIERLNERLEPLTTSQHERLMQIQRDKIIAAAARGETRLPGISAATFAKALASGGSAQPALNNPQTTASNQPPTITDPALAAKFQLRGIEATLASIEKMEEERKNPQPFSIYPQIESMSKTRAAEKNITFEAAMTEILNENPLLYTAYANEYDNQN